MIRGVYDIPLPRMQAQGSSGLRARPAQRRIYVEVELGRPGNSDAVGRDLIEAHQFVGHPLLPHEVTIERRIRG